MIERERFERLSAEDAQDVHAMMVAFGGPEQVQGKAALYTAAAECIDAKGRPIGQMAEVAEAINAMPEHIRRYIRPSIFIWAHLADRYTMRLTTRQYLALTAARNLFIERTNP